MLQDKRGRLLEPLGKWHEELDSKWRYSSTGTKSTIVQHQEDHTNTANNIMGGSINKIFSKDTSITQHERPGNPVPACMKENGIYVRGEVEPMRPMVRLHTS